MAVKKLIARRTFFYQGKKHREGSEVAFKNQQDLNIHIKRGLVVEKMFVDPYGDEPIEPPEPTPENRRLNVESQSEKLADKTLSKSSVSSSSKKSD